MGGRVRTEWLDMAATRPDHWMVVGFVGVAAFGALAAAIAAALARHLPTALLCACFSGVSLGTGLAASGLIAAGLVTVLAGAATLAAGGAAFIGLSEPAAPARRFLQVPGALIAALVIAACVVAGLVVLVRDRSGAWRSEALALAERLFLANAPDFAPALAALCGALVLMTGALAVHLRLGRDARGFGVGSPTGRMRRRRTAGNEAGPDNPRAPEQSLQAPRHSGGTR